MQYVVALSRSAVLVRHWFEIDLDDASMEHGARIELRELVPQPRRGSESASQLLTADRPLWRADLFDRLADEPGTFRVAHYHPEFTDNEPCPRVFDPQLTSDPWGWLQHQMAQAGAGAGRHGWPLDRQDAAELSSLATDIVNLARLFSPALCASAEDCWRLTRDAQESVQLMIKYEQRPDLLDLDWIRPWLREPA